MQRQTYDQILGLLSSLNKDQQENQLYTVLDIKEAAILHKYLTAISNCLNFEDPCKFLLSPLHSN